MNDGMQMKILTSLLSLYAYSPHVYMLKQALPKIFSAAREEKPELSDNLLLRDNQDLLTAISSAVQTSVMEFISLMGDHITENLDVAVHSYGVCLDSYVQVFTNVICQSSYETMHIDHIVFLPHIAGVDFIVEFNGDKVSR